MHSVSNRYNSNRFYWPQTVRDECFYTSDDVITPIPEPERLADHGHAYKHFCVLPSICMKVEKFFDQNCNAARHLLQYYCACLSQNSYQQLPVHCRYSVTIQSLLLHVVK